MGHEAAVTKRRVLNQVEECIEAVNDSIARVDLVTDKHNAFTDEMATRLAAQGAWLEKVERTAIANRSAVERQIAALATQVSSDVQDLDTRLGSIADLLLRQLIDVRNELARARARALVFEQLGWFGRLKTLLTGQLPEPEPDITPLLLDYEQLRGEGLKPEVAGAGMSSHDTEAAAQASFDAPKVYDRIQRSHALLAGNPVV
jgi:hypothetical protein